MKQHILKCLVLTSLALSGIGLARGQAPTCNQSLTADCLYFPTIEYSIGTEPPEVVLDTVYQDISNMPRRVEMVLRIPRGATGPLPVVIWSHGGADGKTNLDKGRRHHGGVEPCDRQGRISHCDSRASFARPGEP